MKHNLTNMIKRKLSAVVLLCAMFAVSNAAWGTTYYLLGGTSDNPASWTTLASNTSYSFTVDLSLYNNYVGISTSESVANLIAISNSYTFIDASSLTYHFQYKEWGGYKYVNIDTKAAGKYTITFNGTNTYTITAAAASYTISTSGSNCTFSPTSRSIASGGSNTFTVTPASGYKLVSASVTNATCSPTDLGNATTATTITVSNPTAAGTLTVTTAAAPAPEVRIGEKPRFSNCELTVGAYVAQWGCDEVTALNLYYSNNSMFRSDGTYKTGYRTKDVSIDDANVSDTIKLSDSRVESVVSPGEMLYLRVNATNGRLSEFSDVVSVKYECNRFVTADIDVDFKACPGEHQFTWSEMFLSPEPTTWSVTKGGSDAKADFSLVNGQMIWNTAGKTGTSYTYVFTAKKDGYDDATATLTIDYTVPLASSGEITSLIPSETTVNPYQAVELSASGEQGDITMVEWTSTPASATFSDISGDTLPATSTFKADKVGSAMDFKVTVTGYNDNCGSVSESVTIRVEPDTEEECE